MITLTQPDDWHVHLRDGPFLKTTVPDTARTFARALVMPNLQPPLTDIAQINAYRERIIRARPHDTNFEPLMSLYLNEHIRVESIEQAANHSHIFACKLYPAGATTHSAQGVKNIKSLYPIFESMEKHHLKARVLSKIVKPAVNQGNASA